MTQLLEHTLLPKLPRYVLGNTENDLSVIDVGAE